MTTTSLVQPSNSNPSLLFDRRTAIAATVAGALSAAAISSRAAAEEPKENPELENVRALLKAHDEAMKQQDLKAVLACFGEKAAVMGSGPGEIWSGVEEISAAYEHFFQGFEKGKQEFEYFFRIGNLSADMGWLMASGNIKGEKGGKAFEFPINLSLTVSKAGGNWRIASMHFSTLTGEAGADAKQAK